jgi:hypothetical protein
VEVKEMACTVKEVKIVESGLSGIGKARKEQVGKEKRVNKESQK